MVTPEENTEERWSHVGGSEVLLLPSMDGYGNINDEFVRYVEDNDYAYGANSMEVKRYKKPATLTLICVKRHPDIPLDDLKKIRNASYKVCFNLGRAFDIGLIDVDGCFKYITKDTDTTYQTALVFVPINRSGWSISSSLYKNYRHAKNFVPHYAKDDKFVSAHWDGSRWVYAELSGPTIAGICKEGSKANQVLRKYITDKDSMEEEDEEEETMSEDEGFEPEVPETESEDEIHFSHRKTKTKKTVEKITSEESVGQSSKDSGIQIERKRKRADGEPPAKKAKTNKEPSVRPPQPRRKMLNSADRHVVLSYRKDNQQIRFDQKPFTQLMQVATSKKWFNPTLKFTHPSGSSLFEDASTMANIVHFNQTAQDAGNDLVFTISMDYENFYNMFSCMHVFKKVMEQVEEGVVREELYKEEEEQDTVLLGELRALEDTFKSIQLPQTTSFNMYLNNRETNQEVRDTEQEVMEMSKIPPQYRPTKLPLKNRVPTPRVPQLSLDRVVV